MGIFDKLASTVGKFMPAVKMGADIYSAVSGAGANKRATQQAQAGVAEGARLSQEQLADIMEQTRPAIAQQRQVVARDPYAMTPEERREMEGVRQTARRTVTGGALAGSGRAQVRMFNEMEGGARDRMTAGNIRRSDEAAGRLANIGFGAMEKTGQVGGAAAIDTAQLGAKKTLANERLSGRAIGDVMSYINDYNKRRATGVKQTAPEETV